MNFGLFETKERFLTVPVNFPLSLKNDSGDTLPDDGGIVPVHVLLNGKLVQQWYSHYFHNSQVCIGNWIDGPE